MIYENVVLHRYGINPACLVFCGITKKKINPCLCSVFYFSINSRSAYSHNLVVGFFFVIVCFFFFSLSCFTGWCYTVFPRDKKEEDYKETAHSCFSEKTVPSEESLQPTKGIPFSPTFPKILYHQLTYFYQWFVLASSWAWQVEYMHHLCE